MKIVILTDAWHPQVNGVVRSCNSTVKILRDFGYTVEVIHPGHFKNISMPGYEEIKLSYFMGDFIKKYEGEEDIAFHIATEGPIGNKASKLLKKRKWKFTSSFCTMFPDYAWKHYFIPKSWTWWFLANIHNRAERTMVSTTTMMEILNDNGISNTCLWPRGVDTNVFKPNKFLPKDPKVALFVGRLSGEKNIEGFLDLDIGMEKWVVGDGPERKKLERIYKNKGVNFFGNLFGHTLAAAYSMASVFVFPSKSDTFGLVNIEAMACGTPVAAFPVQGPKDIFTNEDGVGWMDEDLKTAIQLAIKNSDGEKCRKHALGYDWNNCTKKFRNNLHFINTKDEHQS